MAALHIRLFGGFEARLGSGEALSLKGRKTQALVACLALPPGEQHTRDELVAQLWSDRGDQQARSSLRQSLSELRKALGDPERSPLIAGRDAVSLDADAVEVDVTEFERLIDEGTPAALEQAAALYRGDLLDGIGVHDPAFEDWLRGERQRLHERACEALSSLLDHQAQDTERAIATARRLLALDPLRETVHRTLMRLYASKGERTLALKQYQACRDVLAAELGLSPEPETERLTEEIRTGAKGTGEDLDPAPERRAPESEPLPLPDKPSIAVLPFVNISGDPEQEYFADGITEDIITELSRFRSLFVIARNSSFTFKGQAVDVTEVGKKLGVQYVVEGSVRKAGNRVRITAQLVEAATGNHVWAERYDRDLEDIFVVQDEVAQAIAAAVPGQVHDAIVERAKRKPTESLTAYDCLMRGEWLQWRDYGNPLARELFERAIEIDPQCARAHARLAEYHLYSRPAHGAPYEEAESKARSYAERALAIDERDPIVHSAAAGAYILIPEHDLAKRHAERALALNPNDATVMRYAGLVLTYLGEHDAAQRLYERALRLDPYFGNQHREDLFDFYYMSRRYDDAIELTKDWHDLPLHMHLELAAAYAQSGRLEKARAEVDKVERSRPEGYDVARFIRGHAEICKRLEDSKNWLEGYRKAGLQV